MRLPIRVRLTAWYVLLLAVTLAAVGAFVVVRLKADLQRDIDRSEESSVAEIAQGYRAEGNKEFYDVSGTVLRILPVGTSGAQLLDPSGRVLLTYGNGVAQRPMIGPAAQRAALAGQRFHQSHSLGPRREAFRIYVVPVVRHGQTRLLVVAKSLADVNRSADRVIVLLLLGGGAALVLTAAGGWWLAGKALRPVARMTSQAQGIGIDRLDDRVPVPRASDELAQLARTLNGMLDRLQRGVEEKHRLVADASHELRTPLAVMRSELDVALMEPGLPGEARSVLVSSREEVEGMTRTVENLLTLARVDEGRLELLHRPVELSDLAARVARSLAPVAESSGVSIDVAGSARPVPGDRDRLQQVLANLVQNAVTHTDRGGSVKVRVWDNSRDAGATVSDDGPGIPAGAQAHVFERFYRVDGARSRDNGGSGLGLAICREIVMAHGGHIEVESREGHGSAFSFSVPANET
jgi:two-component system OmpR family sensor kinase